MKLEGFPKEFYAWAQPRIPVSLRLSETGGLVEAKGELFSLSGLWSLELLAVKEGGDAFWFFAKRDSGETRRVEVVGHWPADQETLAAVLASLPRQAN
jgi:hypothetical protein